MFLVGNMAQLEILLAIVPALVLVGLAKLASCRGRGKRALLVMGCVFLACAGLLCLNGILMQIAGIVLRDVPTLILLAVGGLAAVLWLLVAAEVYVLKNITGGNRFVRETVKGGVLLLIVLLCSFVFMVAFAGLVFGNVLAEIRVVEFDGQQLVERDVGFLDKYYEYHASYGPLFRGTELLYQGPTPLC